MDYMIIELGDDSYGFVVSMKVRMLAMRLNEQEWAKHDVFMRYVGFAGFLRKVTEPYNEAGVGYSGHAWVHLNGRRHDLPVGYYNMDRVFIKDEQGHMKKLPAGLLLYIGDKLVWTTLDARDSGIMFLNCKGNDVQGQVKRLANNLVIKRLEDYISK